MSYKEKAPISVSEGGTGNISLTAHSVLVGEGTSAITPLSVGTNGQVLVGSTGADPVFATLTSSSLTYTTGAGSLAIDITAPVSIANGGTNATSMTTTDGVVYFDGTRLVTTAVGSATQVLTSNGAGNAPTFQPVASSSLTWSVISASQSAVASNGYFVNGAGTVVLTLPTLASVGDTFEVNNINNATGTQIAQNAGQTIFIGNTNTTAGAGGSLTSTAKGDTLRLVCSGTNTTWRTQSLMGNWTVV